MEQLILEAISNKSPHVNFNPANGSLLLNGTSCMENARGFYTDIITWMERYVSNPPPDTTLKISLNYFNTSSAKCLLELLEKAASLNSSGKKITITWHYLEGDDDMKEAAETFAELIDYPIDMKPQAAL